jgi:hypothetical protein
MPQLQKAIPVAAAPLKKFLRVVMSCPLDGFGVSMTGRLNCRPLFCHGQIAKPEARRQSS